jgi:hypothetical protein
MTSLLYYLLQVSLYAGFAYVIYFFTWRNSTLHTYSRWYLLAGMVLSCLLPFIHLPIGENSVLVHYNLALPLAAGEPSHQLSDVRHIMPTRTVFSWTSLFAGIYFTGILLLALLYLRSYIIINRKLKRGTVTKYQQYTVITNTAIGPGTLGKRIFFPGDTANEMILQHELAHIRAGHRYDALLIQLAHIVLWISPAHWLLGRELKMVHEFEADNAANKSSDPAEYASLLVSQQLRISPSLLVTHSFFQHPLKRRIMMLQKIKSPKTSLLFFASVMATATLTSIALLAQTEKSEKTEIAASADPEKKSETDNTMNWNRRPKQGEMKLLNDGTMAFLEVEEMPAFDGNMGKWLNNNLQRLAGSSEEVQAVIAFVINDNGSIRRPYLLRSSGNAAFDAEAIRLVGLMPTWKPGTLNGNTVPVYYTLSIYFKDGKIEAGGC